MGAAVLVSLACDALLTAGVLDGCDTVAGCGMVAFVTSFGNAGSACGGLASDGNSVDATSSNGTERRRGVCDACCWGALAMTVPAGVTGVAGEDAIAGSDGGAAGAASARGCHAADTELAAETDCERGASRALGTRATSGGVAGGGGWAARLSSRTTRASVGAVDCAIATGASGTAICVPEAEECADAASSSSPNSSEA